MQKMKPSVVEFWIDEMERALFPHQESEFEQESFTDMGRERVREVLQKLVKAVQERERTSEPTL